MKRATLMIDSGAFSAWRRGAVIDIDQYADFLHQNIELIDYYVNLDVIPGEFGRVPSQAEVDASANASWENFLHLRGRGLESIPVFHQGEDFKWLETMLVAGCKYVGISPANDRTTKEKKLWLDRVFAVIPKGPGGYPLVKTHAFGMTSTYLIFRYPWFSVDSSSWAITAGMGNILLPGRSLSKPPLAVKITRAESKSQHSDKDYWSLTDAQKVAIDQHLAACGIRREHAEDRFHFRAAINAMFFVSVQQEVNRRRGEHGKHPVASPGRLITEDNLASHPEATSTSEFRFFFAIWLSQYHMYSVARAAGQNCLISFVHFQDGKNAEYLEKMANRGAEFEQYLNDLFTEETYNEHNFKGNTSPKPRPLTSSRRRSILHPLPDPHSV